MLYFFYEPVPGVAWGFDPTDRGSWRVLYYTGDVSILARRAFPKNLTREYEVAASAVAFRRELMVPRHKAAEVAALGLTRDQLRAYEKIETLANDPDSGTEPRTRLLGYPDVVQFDDMEVICQLVSHGLKLSPADDPRRKGLEGGARDWRLLYQVDSEDVGLPWGARARLYYWIRKQDLARADFSNVWMNLQSE